MKKIAIVDNKDKVIDGLYRYQITDEIKRIAAVIIIKSNGNILLSKKSLLKDKKERIGYSAVVMLIYLKVMNMQQLGKQ